MTASWRCIVVVYAHRMIHFVVAAVAVAAAELGADNHFAVAAVFVAAVELEDGNHFVVEKIAVVGADMKTEDHHFAAAAVAVEQSFAAE